MSAKVLKNALPNAPPTNQEKLNFGYHLSVISYLHRLSGQEKEIKTLHIEHNYSKSWNVHPDPNIKSRPAKFLFMSDFPRHFARPNVSNEIDVESIEVKLHDKGINPILAEAQGLLATKQQQPSHLDQIESENIEIQAPNKAGWTGVMHKLWTKSLKILQNDRLSRLAFEGLPNEIILKRNLLEKCCRRFRHLFTSITMWEPKLLIWLHSTLSEHITPIFLFSYHEAMQSLRQRLPLLVDRFYTYPKHEIGSVTRMKPMTADPIMTVLNNHKPKRIIGSPLFLIIPNGPQVPHVFTSQRMKHWHSLFGSLGKVITVTVNQKPSMRIADCLHDIRLAVRDKIKECRSTFNESRALILVGFGPSSLIAAHCALNNAPQIKATICLGFPLTGVNGFRGDLDDPLLETTVPTLFVIGQNSTMSTLDDMEDFRERIIRTETGLVVIGGANDRLMVCNSKKRFAGITQTMVDRCVADEIHEFVSHIINPNYNSPDYQNISSLSTSGSPKKEVKRTDTVRKSIKVGSDMKTGNIKRKRTAVQVKSEVELKVPKQTTIPKDKVEVSSINTEKKSLPTTIEPAQRTAIISAEANIITNKIPTQNLPEQKPLEDHLPISEGSLAQGGDPLALYQGLERHYGWSYGVSEIPTVISSGTTRTRHIRAPKQLDM